jgi:hypothetical protein
MLSTRFVILSLVVLVVSLSVLSTPFTVLAETTQGEAQSAIAAAQRELIICYKAVANASSAGANVTALIQVLDEAGGNLSLADLAYKNGDNASAQSYAVESLNLLVNNNVTTRAASLRNSAASARFLGFMINVVGSLVGALDVVVAGFVVWTFLKRKYPCVGGVAR